MGLNSSTFSDVHRLQSMYGSIPGPLRPIARRAFEWISRRPIDDHLHAAFVEALFDDPRDYRKYCKEFDEGPVTDALSAARETFKSTTGVRFGQITTDVGRDIYALTRELAPATIVETGVCNGYSTLCLLAALDENGVGELYSIDYPFTEGRSVEEFRSETFDRFGAAGIPAGREPGWIVPHELRDPWTLRLGKSQRELPRLRAQLDGIDLFLHDSEHSVSCMMYEFELAREWLRPGGILIADDVTWTPAFDLFVDDRDLEAYAGRLTSDVGYVRIEQ